MHVTAIQHVVVHVASMTFFSLLCMSHKDAAVSDVNGTAAPLTGFSVEILDKYRSKGGRVLVRYLMPGRLRHTPLCFCGNIISNSSANYEARSHGLPAARQLAAPD